MENKGYQLSQSELEQAATSSLSLELAKRDPEHYKVRLVNILEHYTHYSDQAWQKLCERGKCSFEDLKIDTSTLMSKSNIGSEIVIGAQPWPEDLWQRCFFEADSFKGEKEKVLILTHEMGHKLIGGDSDPEVTNLFATLRTIRQSTGKGLSGLGSLNFYRDRGGLMIRLPKTLSSYCRST